MSTAGTAEGLDSLSHPPTAGIPGPDRDRPTVAVVRRRTRMSPRSTCPSVAQLSDNTTHSTRTHPFPGQVIVLWIRWERWVMLDDTDHWAPPGGPQPKTRRAHPPENKN